MDVYLSFNSSVYTLKIRSMDIWTHQGSIDTPDMIEFLKELFKNNPNLINEVK